MFKIKRLYTFILQTFMPLFVMTFCICLFIVLMQFLWRYVDDLVGKGLEVSIIAELFFYASLTMVPLALPLAILLASLMVFGNLGERLELTAMKSAGVSLMRIMSPLTVFILLIAIGAFFFQNEVLPRAQVQMYTLLFSMRQKSPELDIPEGTFYNQIEGYNMFIQHKDRKNGKLHGVMIYDVARGSGNANIIVADSGRLSFNDRKDHLFLELWSGESFEDLRTTYNNGAGNAPSLFRRETFRTKEILIPFDANFTKMDEEGIRSQYVGKNVSELRVAIDSIHTRIDSIGRSFSANFKQSDGFYDLSRIRQELKGHKLVDIPVKYTPIDRPIDFDSLFQAQPVTAQRAQIMSALEKAQRIKEEYTFKALIMSDELETLHRHDIELQKKFTLAIACIIFFFIGAPLGSIIRKGGLAVPIVISVLLFVVYYIIDSSGQKLAKEGIWPVWEGVWLSTAVLAPMGIWLTIKASNDSAVFNTEFYMKWLRRIIGQRILRQIQMKEIVMIDVTNDVAIPQLEQLIERCEEFLSAHRRRPSYRKYWLSGLDYAEVDAVSQPLEQAVQYLNNSCDVLVVNKLMDFPVLRPLFFYRPSSHKALSWAMMLIFPLGGIGYLIGIKQYKNLKKDINTIISVSKDTITLLRKAEDNKTDKSDE